MCTMKIFKLLKNDESKNETLYATLYDTKRGPPNGKLGDMC